MELGEVRQIPCDLDDGTGSTVTINGAKRVASFHIRWNGSAPEYSACLGLRRPPDKNPENIFRYQPD